jgi:hypothetical protein
MQYRTYKVIYRRYAGLFFSMCIDVSDNELVLLEAIHLFVEILDHYFENVCELDLVFNFHKVLLGPTAVVGQSLTQQAEDWESGAQPNPGASGPIGHSCTQERCTVIPFDFVWVWATGNDEHSQKHHSWGLCTREDKPGVV